MKKGELVLVMFSGVAPYPIVISKNSKAEHIYGVELNRKAHKYALENINLNKVKNVTLFHGDVRKLVPRSYKVFDRIIMPLPKTADDFLLSALKVCKENAVIHWYSFCGEEEIERSVSERLKLTIKDSAKYDIMNVQRAGQSSPGKMRVCADIRIKKNNAA